MATVRKRIPVTVDDEIYDALEAYSNASGQSKSAFMAFLLKESIPTIKAMTKAFEVAQKRPQKALDIMVDHLAEAHFKVAQVQIDYQEEKKAKKRGK